MAYSYNNGPPVAIPGGLAAVTPQRTPLFLYPAPQLPSQRSVDLPPVVRPGPSIGSRYKAAVSPQFTPAGWYAMHQIRNGSGTKTL